MQLKNENAEFDDDDWYELINISNDDDDGFEMNNINFMFRKRQIQRWLLTYQIHGFF